MSSKTNGRGDAGDGDLGRGEDGEHHTRYPHGTWGRGGSATGVAGQGEGLGSGLGSNQVGKRRESDPSCPACCCCHLWACPQLPGVCLQQPWRQFQG